MIDAHTHLNFKAFSGDWEKVVQRAIDAGVAKMVVVGTNLASSKKAMEMAEKHEALHAAVGVHPHHARALLEASDTRYRILDTGLKLERLARSKKVVAIGEVGLDYHVYRNTKYEIRNTKNEWKRLINLQKRLLGMQINLAKKLGKPMIIHSREAGEDVLDTIEHFSKSDSQLPRGVFHCFDGSKRYLKKVLAAGFLVSFTGNITYASDRAQVANEVPLDRLLLETDCPYQHPSANGKRSKNTRCEPKDVKILARFHAKQRGINVSEVAEQTTKNACLLFKF